MYLQIHDHTKSGPTPSWESLDYKQGMAPINIEPVYFQVYHFHVESPGWGVEGNWVFFLLLRALRS